MLIYQVAGIMAILLGAFVLTMVGREHYKYGGVVLEEREEQVKSGGHLATIYALCTILILSGLGALL